MGAIDLRTYDWADVGQRPGGASESVYIPLEEPAAELDNDWNYSVREDLKRLNEALGNLEQRVDYIEQDLIDLRIDHDELEEAFWAHNHDTRYYRKHLADDRFVNEDGDDMSGDLVMIDGANHCFTRDDGQRWCHGLTPTPGDHEGDSYSIWLSDAPRGVEFELRNDRSGGYETAEAYVGGQRLATEAWARGVLVDEHGDDMSGNLNFGRHAVTFDRDDNNGQWVVEEHNNDFTVNIGDTGGKEFEVKANASNFRTADAYVGGQQIATRSWANETLVNETGDEMTGDLWMRYDAANITIGEIDGRSHGAHTLTWGTERPGRSMRWAFYTGPEDLVLEDGQNSSLVRYAYDGRVYFEGGAVHLTNSEGEWNDSFDLVFLNEPTDRDARFHLKRNPVDVPDRNGHFFECFSTDDGKSHWRVNIQTQDFEAHELRNIYGGGTPIAHGPLAGRSNPGDIWYDVAQDRWEGQKKNGQVAIFETR